MLFSGLMMIYIAFKPMQIKQQKFVDVPLLNISEFVMHEFNTKGLQTLMSGEKALRYRDRYVIKNMDFTDNAKEYITNMKADNGLYQGDVVTLVGNAVYIREDGLTFKSPTLNYNTKTTIAKTDDAYIAYKEGNSIKGKSLVYDSKKKIMKSKNVIVKYQLKEDTI